jgi:hypothetical protein
MNTQSKAQSNKALLDLSGSYGIELNAQATPFPIDPITTTRIQYHIPIYFTDKLSIGPYLYFDSQFDFWEAGLISKWYMNGIQSRGVSDYLQLLVAGKEYGSNFLLGAGYGLDYHFNEHLAVGANLTLQMLSEETLRLSPGITFRVLR